jgi:hypothetical protein
MMSCARVVLEVRAGQRAHPAGELQQAHLLARRARVAAQALVALAQQRHHVLSVVEMAHRPGAMIEPDGDGIQAIGVQPDQRDELAVGDDRTLAERDGRDGGVVRHRL